MSKVGSGSSPSTRTRTGAKRSNWVRRALSPAASSGKKPSSTSSSGGKRFVEPYRLSDEQRQSIVAALEDLPIGDDQSRSLFTAALEYNLSTGRKLMEPVADPLPPPKEHKPGKEELAIAVLAQAAEGLAKHLQELESDASSLLQQELSKTDRFQRTYGENYLRCLGLELERIAGVAEPLKQSPPQTPVELTLSEDERRFILHTADAFKDCFELAPTAEPDSPFLRTLEAIIQATGIRIPTGSATLSQALTQLDA